MRIDFSRIHGRTNTVKIEEKKILPITILLCAAIGCSYISMEQEGHLVPISRGRLAAMVGKRVETALETLGPPTTSTSIGSGGESYTWEYSRRSARIIHNNGNHRIETSQDVALYERIHGLCAEPSGIEIITQEVVVVTDSRGFIKTARQKSNYRYVP